MGSRQVIELIGFWVRRIEAAGRLKGNKSAGRDAVSQERSRTQGEIRGLVRGTTREVCARGRRINE
jgi:hypothetical protein